MHPQKSTRSFSRGCATAASALIAAAAERAGPARGRVGGGGVTAVAGQRRQPHTFYMGATGGGVWKTTDAGQNWENISDGYFETASIGAIAVAESDPNVIYIGTGSAAIRSNVILG